MKIPGQISAAINIDAYMLLDSSSQRAKSWSCEHCENWANLQDIEICRGCYWAFPEDYSHVAMSEHRRVDIRWDNDEVRQYDELKREAKKHGLAISSLIKKRLSE